MTHNKSPCNLSIVIPTYNERENIQSLLNRVVSVMERSGCFDFEIIVVDDYSPDKTYEIVEEISRKDPRIKLIVRKQEKGLGTAIKRGIKEAKNQYVVVMDADFQHPPETIPVLYKTATTGEYDLVVASRYTKDGGVEGWSKIRLIASKIGCYIARLLIRSARKTSDPMSGFFIVRKESIITDNLKPKGYKILLDILGRHNHLKVTDVPYIFRNRARGRSKVNFKTLTDFISHIYMLSDLLKFASVGTMGMIVNLAIMWFFMSIGFSKEYSSIAGIEASILSNFFMNNVFTFGYRSRNTRFNIFVRLGLYHLSSSISAVTTFATMILTTKYVGIHPLLGQFIGILLGFAANYLLSSRVIWVEQGETRENKGN